jgi:hypothetical protein
VCVGAEERKWGRRRLITASESRDEGAGCGGAVNNGGRGGEGNTGHWAVKLPSPNLLSPSLFLILKFIIKFTYSYR